MVKEEVNPYLILIPYLGNPKDSTKRFLELINSAK